MSNNGGALRAPHVDVSKTEGRTFASGNPNFTVPQTPGFSGDVIRYTGWQWRGQFDPVVPEIGLQNNQPFLSRQKISIRRTIVVPIPKLGLEPLVEKVRG